MLTDGNDRFNITQALEVTKAITNVNATDLGCSEQVIPSINIEIAAAKDKAYLVVQVETEIIGSLSEALGNLCPGLKTRTGRNKYI